MLRKTTSKPIKVNFPGVQVLPMTSINNMTALNYEIAHRGAGDLKTLADNSWEKDFIAGVIDVKSVEIEQADQVAGRMRNCLAVVPPERLGLSTDCGLINLPRRVAQAKLRSLVEGANIVRAELTAAAPVAGGMSLI
jgi:5-methyltetrahydropteroyltriglutamate--homocysteine methyltransferase